MDLLIPPSSVLQRVSELGTKLIEQMGDNNIALAEHSRRTISIELEGHVQHVAKCKDPYCTEVFINEISSRTFL